MEIRLDRPGHRPSAGVVARAMARCAGLLKPVVEKIRSGPLQTPMPHPNESGVRRGGKTCWTRA
ncbi:MAG: hypothetical protein EOP86_01165 [Verrucomicrobiaceae bacterium]|nr:MAG: hypothetical protein EOP86_01165 [Verrucomicrobiaceae bacterium]